MFGCDHNSNESITRNHTGVSLCHYVIVFIASSSSSIKTVSIFLRRIHLAILARKENRSKVDELRLLVQQRMGQLGIEQQQKKRERSSGDTADISVKESRVGVLTDGSIIGD